MYSERINLFIIIIWHMLPPHSLSGSHNKYFATSLPEKNFLIEYVFLFLYWLSYMPILNLRNFSQFLISERHQ